MQSGGQTYRSMADIKSLAASPESAALSETLGLVADVPSWTGSKYRTRNGRMSDARRFAGLFSDGRCKTMVDRCSMQHDTDIGT